MARRVWHMLRHRCSSTLMRFLTWRVVFLTQQVIVRKVKMFNQLKMP